MKLKINMALILLLMFLAGCSQLEKIQIEDIKHGGLYFERDKLMNYGITGFSIDEKDKIHFYVQEIKPNTRQNVENALIKYLVKGSILNFMGVEALRKGYSD